MLTVSLAMVALIAFSGIVWYAYDQGRRVGSRQAVPVIAAEPGPHKVRPEDPGGMKVPHQDKLVLRDLGTRPADGGARVERLPLAPRGPAPAPTPAAAPAPEEPVAATPAAPAATATLPAAAPAPQSQPPHQPPAAEAGESAETVEAGESAGLTESDGVAVPPMRPARPAPAPATTASVPAATPTATPAPATPAPAAAAPAGGYRVQLASLRSEAAARREWRRLIRIWPGLLGSLQLTVRRVDLGSARGVYFRVLAGPLSAESARRVCVALAARRQACIVQRR